MRLEAIGLFARGQRQIRESAGVEDAREGVVILSRNRVELMIVAAGAGDGQSEEAAGQGINAVVQFVSGSAGGVGVLVVLRPQAEEAQGRLVVDPGIGEEIRRDLQGDEAIIRQCRRPGRTRPSRGSARRWCSA